MFSNSFKDRVPLYLSNKKTHQALGEIVTTYNKESFLDLGCGTGGVVSYMAQGVTKISHGVETAPAPYLIAKIQTFFKSGEVFAKDIWGFSTNEYDMVYAFLSPEPMTEVWNKLAKEMKPGSLFVSNSFAIPDVLPIGTVNVDDKRETRLFIYEIPERSSS
jgi:SAM-dependent methyltransferase